MSDIKKCPHCGKALHSNARYCMFCMTTLHSKEDITPTVHVRRRKWIVICLTVLFLLSVLLVVSVLPKKSSSLPANRNSIKHNNFYKNIPANQTNPSAEKSPVLQDDVIVTENSPTENTPTENKQSDNIPTEYVPAENMPTENISTVNTSSDEPTNNDADSADTEQGSGEQVKPVCNHQYKPASCISPATCSTCGETTGTVNTSAHSWDAVTEVVHHDEVGHYESVAIQRKKTVYLCFFCGYNQDGYDSLDALRVHIVVHSNSHNYDAIVARPDMLADTKEVTVTEYEQQWVVDEKAYDETIIVGYVCSLCKFEKTQADSL